MVDLSLFSSLELPGGFVVTEVTETESGMIDAIGRTALAKTIIIGSEISIMLAAGMDDIEKSRSIYHEMLEGLAVATPEPPPLIIDFNEADFEAAAITAHAHFGFADPHKVIRFLRSLGF
jgi:hypothetical protein